jgi:hypothetical protein
VDSSNVIKTVAAFVAGLVIALGGTLIYVRTNEMVHPQQIVQSAPRTQEISQPEEIADTSVPDSVPVLKPVPKYHAKKHAAAAKPDPEPAPEPKPEVAQNTPPADAPAPVVNDTQQQPATVPPDNPAPAAPQPSSPAPQAQPHTVTLSAGTNIVIRLGETLSTEHNYTGDTFRATLESPIVVDGFIIADKGSKVLGKIVNAQKPGHVQGVAELILAVTEINTTDGQRVKVETSTWDKKAPKSTDEDAAKIAGGAALGAVIGAIAGGGKGAAIGAGVGGAAGTGAVIGTRGKTATLPIETRLTFRLANPVTITEKLNQ